MWSLFSILDLLNKRPPSLAIFCLFEQASIGWVEGLLLIKDDWVWLISGLTAVIIYDRMFH